MLQTLKLFRETKPGLLVLLIFSDVRRGQSGLCVVYLCYDSFVSRLCLFKCKLLFVEKKINYKVESIFPLAPNS